MAALSPHIEPTTKRRPRIGVFLEWIANSYTDAVLRHIARIAETSDCDTVYFVGGFDDSDFPRATRHHPAAYANAQNLDGALVVSMGSALDSRQIAGALAHLEPLPVCAIAVRWDEYPSVEVDNEVGVRLGIDHLVTVHGRRRIACIRGPHNSAEARARFYAYQSALEEHGLPFDPALVVSGDYIPVHGRDAVRCLLDERRVQFDAIVSANDSMALGALAELQQRGVQVPEQVALLGFDDMAEARHAEPPLTSVRQPIAEHAEAAFAHVLAQLRGEQVPRKLVVPSELVLRRSCGCTQSAQRPLTAPPAPSRHRTRESFSDLLVRWFHPLAHYLAKGHLDRARQLVRLCVEGAGGKGPTQGLGALRSELERLSHEHHDLLRALPILQDIQHRALDDLNGRDECAVVVEFCSELCGLIAEAVERHEATQRYSKERLSSLLLRNQRALAQAVTLSEVEENLAECLARFQIDSCFLCLYDGDEVPAKTARVMLAASPSRKFEIPPQGLTFSTRHLLPARLMASQGRSALIQYPLFLAEKGACGYVLLERGAVGGFVHDALAQQVFAAYRRVELMDQVIFEARRREAAEHHRLEREMRIATNIQMGILPRRVEVPGLEIAAVMVPATEVGGDYYDVIPSSDGCWFGIGDVAGHGLPAGLVMVMLQSAIGGLARNDPDASPSQILSTANDLLVDNIRNRLLQDEHVTLTLLRYHRSGRIVHAGAHEEILVYRAASDRVEPIETPGSWVGIRAHLEHTMEDHEFTLEEGDLMLLHTDGITEARNARGEMFGMQRVADLLREHHAAPVESIRDKIVSAVRDWMERQDDDVTLLLVRQLKPRR